jgi:TPR repeat protein
MTIKELAFSAQQHLQASTGTQIKRAHIYELLAAAFGFGSYAALCADAVFTIHSLTNWRSKNYGEHIRRRCIEIGYQADTAVTVATALPTLMTDKEIGVVRISDLIAHLRFESGRDDWLEEDEQEELDADEDEHWPDPVASPLLLDGLNAAADKGHAPAHYALALIYSSTDEDFGSPGVGGDYWYKQAQEGRALTGVEKEWADAHATRLAREEKSMHHLREAAKLGHQAALLDLADRFDDPTFFEQKASSVNAHPSRIAEIAERMGRTEDAKIWLTEAAKLGDTDAMRQLIDEYDYDNLQQCWTWVYLAQLLGTDLTKDEYMAIHEDGSPYDDDVGGAVFADGRDGVKLTPISEQQEMAARRSAREIYAGIQRTNN